MFNLSSRIAVLFGGAGVLAYVTFGSDVQTVVLLNLDQKSKMVQSVRASLHITTQKRLTQTPFASVYAGPALLRARDHALRAASALPGHPYPRERVFHTER